MSSAALEQSPIITFESAIVTTMPIPALVTDGADITSLGAGGYRPDHLQILLTASGTGTLTGPVNLCGWDATDLKWYLAKVLNGGADIDMLVEFGYTERVPGVGVFARLALACAAITAVTTYTAKAKLVDVRV